MSDRGDSTKLSADGRHVTDVGTLFPCLPPNTDLDIQAGDEECDSDGNKMDVAEDKPQAEEPVGEVQDPLARAITMRE